VQRPAGMMARLERIASAANRFAIDHDDYRG
jgi:hypothetical protein